jgi:hypothetical protein
MQCSITNCDTKLQRREGSSLGLSIAASAWLSARVSASNLPARILAQLNLKLPVCERVCIHTPCSCASTDDHRQASTVAGYHTHDDGARRNYACTSCQGQCSKS